jgi:hypothetical protein
MNRQETVDGPVSRATSESEKNMEEERTLPLLVSQAKRDSAEQFQYDQIEYGDVRPLACHDTRRLYEVPEGWASQSWLFCCSQRECRKACRLDEIVRRELRSCA